MAEYQLTFYRESVHGVSCQWWLAAPEGARNRWWQVMLNLWQCEGLQKGSRDGITDGDVHVFSTRPAHKGLPPLRCLYRQIVLQKVILLTYPTYRKWQPFQLQYTLWRQVSYASKQSIFPEKGQQLALLSLPNKNAKPSRITIAVTQVGKKPLFTHLLHKVWSGDSNKHRSLTFWSNTLIICLQGM